ncbi:unnamed protein product, partial [Closterium sp. Naga37s-1]
MTYTITLGKRKTHGSGERPRLLQWLLPPLLLVVATVAGLSHWSLSRDKIDFTVLNGKALLKASQKIANMWKASGETGELSGYLADGSEDAYIGDGGRAGEVDPWRCADGSGGNECAHAAAVILAEGSLSERVHAVCAAYALTALTNKPTLALWPADRHLPATTFRHLFSAPPAPNSSRSSSSGGDGAEVWGVSGGEGGVWVRDLPVRSDALRTRLAASPQQQVVLRPCRGRSSSRSLPPPPHLFLAPHSAAAEPHTPHAPPAHGAAAAAAGAAEGEGGGAGLFLGEQDEAARVAQGRVEVDLCEYERRVEECLGALEPSPFVASLVLKEDVHRLTTSTAFYVDPLGPSGCAGCSEESEYSPPMCAMRRIAMTYLADRAVSFTLAAHSPAHVLQIMDYFPPARSPLLLHATQSRIATCQLEEEVEVEEGEGREKGVGSGEEDVVGGEVISSLAAGLVAVSSSALEPPSPLPPLPPHPPPCPTTFPQVSELFSMSLAAGLVAVNSSALEPRFIAAQAARRSPSFRLHVSVCGRHEIRPITKQKWSMFTMVEGEGSGGWAAGGRQVGGQAKVNSTATAGGGYYYLRPSPPENLKLFMCAVVPKKLKIFICTVPKVAANSWLMWLRAMLGQPHPEDPLLALDDDRAGWHMLHVHFTEKQAVSVLPCVASTCALHASPLCGKESAILCTAIPPRHPSFHLPLLSLSPPTTRLHSATPPTSTPYFAAAEAAIFCCQQPMCKQPMCKQPMCKQPMCPLSNSKHIFLPSLSLSHSPRLQTPPSLPKLPPLLPRPARLPKPQVRAMTRPDLFRFTFVRNPFSRVLSAYNNKLVVTDSPNNKTGPGSREYWNNAFFWLIRSQWEALKGEDDLVSFHDFVKLVGVVFKERRWHMDRHIALQRDVCALGLIKYDFVGRFENLEKDAKYVVNRFGGDHLDIFNFGINAHQTRADEKLVKMYDK